MDEQEHKNNVSRKLSVWNKQAKTWHLRYHPGRPSPKDIELYQKLSGDKLSGRVLIFGATPELRDLAANYGAKVVLVDLSIAMMQEMLFFTKVARMESETWIKSEWQEAPLPNNYFDLVLGDCIWGELDQSSQQRVRDKIADVVKTDGLFISRFRIKPAPITEKDPRNIVQKYLLAFERNPSEKSLLARLLLTDLDNIASINRDRFDRNTALGWIRESMGHICFECDNFLKFSLTTKFMPNTTAQTTEEILEVLNSKFKFIREENNEHGYNVKAYPIFAFSKRNRETL